jgi:predicted secreted protein
MCLAAIAAFGFGAWYFGKWWMNLFNLIPLAMFNRRTIVLDTTDEKGEDANDD